MINKGDFEIVHPVVAELDVHKLNIPASIRRVNDHNESVVETREFTALPSGLEEMTAWLQEARVAAALMEGTGIYWLPPFEALEEAGLKPMLVHVHKVKQIRGRKTDKNDSVWLARVCQFGLATWSFVPPRPFRAMRQSSRHRRKVMNVRGGIQNRIHKLLDRRGIQIGGILADIFGLNGRRILTGLRDGKSKEEIMRTLTDHVASKFELIRDALTKSLDEEDRYLLGELIEMRDEETRHIESALKRLKEQATPWQRNLDLLQTIPGIDDQSAADLLSEMGADLDVFGSPSRFAAWAGVCPGDNESAGKRRPAKARKGSAHMRTLLVNCAHAAARTKDSQYHGFHRTHTHRLGCKRAIVATAHKLARTVYAVLRDQKPYEDPGVDYEEIMVRRNAPRWTQALEKYNIEYLGTTSKRS